MKTAKPLSMILGLLLSAGLCAQDGLLDASNDVLDSQQIDIDGYYTEKPKSIKGDHL